MDQESSDNVSPSSAARSAAALAALMIVALTAPASSTATARSVKIGGRTETKVEILEGLKGGETIAARTIVWAAGNVASPLGASLGVPQDAQGRVIVREDLTIPGHRHVFVIGDQAHFAPGGGTPLPGLSPVAMQQGRHVAKNIRIGLAGGWLEAFDYFDKGTMATIGRHRAVCDAGMQIGRAHV